MADIPAPARFIDLARYPVHDLQAPATRALIERCRADLESQAFAVIDDFLTPDAVACFWDESMSLLGQANRREAVRSAYLETPDREDMSWPEGHPRRRFFRTWWGVVADDLIPQGHGLRQLYEWEGLTAFFAEALQVRPLYRHADRFQALNINVLNPGDEQAWHFDDMDFVVLLYLTTPQAGGELECASLVRSDDEPRYDLVAQAFDGTYPRLHRRNAVAGTLTIMRGHHSVHRVTPVEGDVPRLTAVLAYDRVPDKRESDEINTAIFGERVRPLLEAGFNRPKISPSSVTTTPPTIVRALGSPYGNLHAMDALSSVNPTAAPCGSRL